MEGRGGGVEGGRGGDGRGGGVEGRGGGDRRGGRGGEDIHWGRVGAFAWPTPSSLLCEHF